LIFDLRFTIADWQSAILNNLSRLPTPHCRLPIENRKLKIVNPSPLVEELVRQAGIELGEEDSAEAAMSPTRRRKDGVIVFDPSGHKKCGNDSVGVPRFIGGSAWQSGQRPSWYLPR
jgi:hypothetical protein